jgi:hypothetical protein
VFWLVRDIAEGKGSHQLELTWHIGAGLSACADRDVFAGAGTALAILAAEGHGWSRTLDQQKWSPAYGCSESAQVLRFAAARELPEEFATILIAGPGTGSSQGRLIRTREVGNGVTTAYQFLRKQENHSFVFASEAEPWTQGPWASDADFLYSYHDRPGRLCSVLICNGTYADFEGMRVISCGRRVSYAEVSRGNHRPENSGNDRWDLFSSDVNHVSLGPAFHISLA